MEIRSKKYAKKLISSSIDDAFEYLSEILNTDSMSFNDFIIQKNRFKKCQQDFV